MESNKHTDVYKPWNCVYGEKLFCISFLSSCRAPIASLDCMEEFSAGSALSALGDRSGDGAITKEQLLLGGLTHSAPAAPAQLSRQTSITPGLRYRNLGKSGLRVSNIGLGDWNPHKSTGISRRFEMSRDTCGTEE